MTTQSTSYVELKKTRHSAVLAQYPTSKHLIATLNLGTADMRYREIRSIPTAFSSQVLKLKELEEIYSPATSTHFVEAWVNQLILYMGLPLDANVVTELSRHFADEAKVFNLAELTLFFRRVKRGKYGAFYGQFDPVLFMTWLREFKEERAKYIATLSDNYISPELEKFKNEYYGSKGSKEAEKGT